MPLSEEQKKCIINTATTMCRDQDLKANYAEQKKCHEELEVLNANAAKLKAEFEKDQADSSKRAAYNSAVAEANACAAAGQALQAKVEVLVSEKGLLHVMCDHYELLFGDEAELERWCKAQRLAGLEEDAERSKKARADADEEMAKLREELG